MRLVFVSLLLICLSGIGVSRAIGFDGDRRGFVLGFGAGPGIIAEGERIDSSAGLQTDLKIGVGISRRTLIHYTGKQYWLRNDKSFFTLATPMAGITYYFCDGSPSPLVTAGGGPSLAAEFWKSEVGGATGLAVFAGAGYELDTHWSVEFNTIHNIYAEASVWNFALTVNLLGY